MYKALVFILSITLLFGFLVEARSQNIVYTEISVTYEDGTPLQQKMIDISLFYTDTLQGLYSFDSLTFDSGGKAIIIYNLPPNETFGLEIAMPNCPILGNTIVGLDTITPTTDTIRKSFIYCQGAAACEVDFIPELRPNLALALDADFLNVDPFESFSYQWILGDGSQSTGDTLQYTYQQPGDYFIQLAVRGSFGCRDTSRKIITVFDRCEASFTFSQTQARTLQLVGSPQGFSSLFHSWSFGDGAFSPGAQVSHTYATGDEYLVCLSIFDTAYNCFDLVCDTIFVGDSSNCRTDFSTTPLSNKTFSFKAERENENSAIGYIYSWDLGDGSQIQAGPEITHTYTTPGLYFVTLTTNSSIGCEASETKDVRADPDPLCLADFVGVERPNLKAIFSALFPREGLAYEWSIGGTPVSNSPTLTYQASTPGMVDICLSILDSSTNCQAQTCQSFDLVGDQNCTPAFTWNGSGQGPYQFINQSVGGEMGDQAFVWDFGDGISTTDRDPTHTFASGSSWEVCLTIRNLSTGCSDVRCRIINAAQGAGFEISGVSYANQMPVYDANALLYELDESSGFQLEVIQPYLASGLFRFENVQPGNYQVWIHPRGEEAEKYLPTYPGNQLYWQDAIGTVVSQANIALPPIEMNIQPPPTVGQGQISGRIFEGLNAQNGPPLVEQVVFLQDQDQEVLTYVLSDGLGEYRFENLPAGTYYVRTEIPGVLSRPRKVVLTNAQQQDGIDFGVDASFAFPTDIEEEAYAHPVFAPNPARGMLKIIFPLEQNIDIQIYNLSHQMIWEGSLRSSEAIAVDKWASGMYFIRWKVGQEEGWEKIQVLE